MFNIALFLQKYVNLEGDFVFQKEIIDKALKEVCNIENIKFEIKKGTLYIEANPLIKSIIFMKKDKIVDYLRQNFPKGGVSDVR